jgi:hypothetical protein
MHVGQVVVAWASIERLLDLLISLDVGTGGREAGRKPKQSLSGKIRLLGEAIRSDSILAPFADDIRPVLDLVGRHKDDRHRLAHGMVLRFLTEAPGGVEIHRIILGFENTETVTLTTPELEGMVPAAEGIAQALIALFPRLAPEVERRQRARGVLGPDATIAVP